MLTANLSPHVWNLCRGILLLGGGETNAAVADCTIHYFRSCGYGAVPVPLGSIQAAFDGGLLLPGAAGWDICAYPDSICSLRSGVHHHRFVPSIRTLFNHGNERLFTVSDMALKDFLRCRTCNHGIPFMMVTPSVVCRVRILVVSKSTVRSSGYPWRFQAYTLISEASRWSIPFRDTCGWCDQHSDSVLYDVCVLARRKDNQGELAKG